MSDKIKILAIESSCDETAAAVVYTNEKAALIVREMAELLMFRLTEKKLVTDSLTLEVGYDRENVDSGGYRGTTQTDRYGRTLPKAAQRIMPIMPNTSFRPDFSIKIPAQL